MSVVPERVHEFYVPPKPQVGTALHRYGFENGYLVLEDFKTLDLPSPPPAGWGSAKRLGLVAVAAVVTFASVVGLAVTTRAIHSDDNTRRPRDPVLARNSTNGTDLPLDEHISTDIEDNNTVEVAGVKMEFTAVPWMDYGRHGTSLEKQKAQSKENTLRVEVKGPHRRSNLISTLRMFDDEDAAFTQSDDGINDVDEEHVVTSA